ncbi:hypothetical protein HKX23_17695 [Sulfitobacter sp. KE29]|uniref:hypothetical protein n=1 Tax=unclassified Sulfitobacter TaxID=196795 RepID=UPI0023E0932E|nr:MULTISPECIES: hypothetical protein [unclassified Sulfitobacter]MDF3420186.1 hypothetical protein [Sulfitobacter sp. Ks38]MDF3427671.1 hypothetical protein [Sulfitobacter sp. KE29]MDF3431250.1 hypothetical protein [Sulfitobacter sp. S46]MDF3446023.1 hypothetical protein [Sulfitobacter sp. KE31]MDF3550032.1 hypothetical protein [Sulfitobacter sp. KE28]
MPVEPTHDYDPLRCERSLPDRVAELEARLAFVTIRLNTLSKRRNGYVLKVSANDVVSGVALVILCVGGLFVAWGLS